MCIFGRNNNGQIYLQFRTFISRKPLLSLEIVYTTYPYVCAIAQTHSEEGEHLNYDANVVRIVC